MIDNSEDDQANLENEEVKRLSKIDDLKRALAVEQERLDYSK